MAKTNNYFSVETHRGRRFFWFDDTSEISTRMAYADARKTIQQIEGGEDLSFTILRPVVWKLEADMGVIGTLISIRHSPDPTVRGAMRLHCTLCGVSAVVRDARPYQRECQVELFEATHAPHWTEHVAKEEAKKRAAASKYAAARANEAAAVKP